MELEEIILIICLIFTICIVVLPIILLINMCYGTYTGITIDNEFVELKFVYTSYGTIKGTTTEDRHVILKEYKEIK